MEFEEYTEYIEKKLHEKGINIETQDYVIKYVYMNQKLFGRVLNIDKVIDRIVNNLNHSIISIDTKNSPLQEIMRILFTKGIWNSYSNKISINPIIKLISILFQREKEKQDSTIMHEIDHCATTEYIDISEQETEQYIQCKLEELKNKQPKIAGKISDEKWKELIRANLNKRYNGKMVNIGIIYYGSQMQNGVDLRKLNEGITAYKQEMYDKFLGNKPSPSYYGIEIKVAKLIGDAIGTDNLVSMHFDNNYEGIRKAFNEKTGKDLNELVNELNKKSEIMLMLFGKIYTINFSKKMEKFMGEFSINSESKKRNTDFIPKFSVDYTKIRLGMDKSKLQENIRDSKNKKEWK